MSEQLPIIFGSENDHFSRLAEAGRIMGSLIKVGTAVAELDPTSPRYQARLSSLFLRASVHSDKLLDFPDVKFHYSGVGIFPVDVSNGHGQFYGEVPPATGTFLKCRLQEVDYFEICDLEELLEDAGLSIEDISDCNLVVPENFFTFSDRIHNPPEGHRLFADFTYHRVHSDNNKVAGIDTVRSDKLRFQHYMDLSQIRIGLVEIDEAIEQNRLRDIAGVIEIINKHTAKYEALINSDVFLRKSGKTQKKIIEAFVEKLNKKLPIAQFEVEATPGIVLVPTIGDNAVHFRCVDTANTPYEVMTLRNLSFDSSELQTLNNGGKIGSANDNVGGLCLVGTLPEDHFINKSQIVWIPLGKENPADLSLIAPSYSDL